MRRGKKSKTRCQDMHAKRRARERFGINLNTDQLTKDIQNQKLVFLERQSRIKTLWYQELEGIKMVIVYDSMRKQVATVFSYEWYLNRGGKDVAQKTKETNKTIKPNQDFLSEGYKECWLNGC